MVSYGWIMFQSYLPKKQNHVKMCHGGANGKMGGILNVFFQALTKIGWNLKESQDH